MERLEDRDPARTNTYEAPAVTDLGTLEELTQGAIGNASDPNLFGAIPSV